MRKAVTAACLCLLALCFCAAAQAGTYVFTPVPGDLGDLDHYYYDSWGINWSPPAGEQIVEATLFIDNINDWTNETGDKLYIHLLDNPAVGVRQWYDAQGGGDAWAGNPLVGVYSDYNSYAEDLAYTFSTLGLLDDLASFASNGVFGLGFDADCHYYNSGVMLTVRTETTQQAIPEPTALLLGSLGLSTVAGLLRRRG